jgi:hypothetical protein
MIVLVLLLNKEHNMNNNNIDKLVNIEAIKNLRILYSHYLDSNRLEELTHLFTVNAIVQTDRDPWHGRDGIFDGLNKAFKEYDKNNHGNYPFLHAVTNHWVEITGPTTAGRPANESPLLLLGLYADEYVLIDDKWYISKSKLDLIWPERNV